MLQATIIKVVVNAILGWLKSAWDRFVEKQKNIKIGRQEVLDDLAKKHAEADKALEELRSTSITDDAARNELLDRAARHYGNSNMLNNGHSTRDGR